MEVRNFTVGPIVGDVTNGMAKIFGRGCKIRQPQHSFGYSICRYRIPGEEWQFAPIRYQQPHFDFSAVSVLSPLLGGQQYEYQAGFVISHRPLQLNPTSHLNWRNIPINRFTTAHQDETAAVSLAFGSCRYLLKLFGGTWFDGRGDKAFRQIYKENVDQVLMLGDQIYADDLNFIAPDKCIDEYLQRYRQVFSQPYFSRLVANTPTYMTLDDHEIEDNWPMNATNCDRKTKYPAALQAYKIYQMSHSPAAQVNRERTKLEKVPTQFWYECGNGCVDIFVLDVRSERTATQIMSDEQMTALKAFLMNSTKKYKFIATSVPIAPEFLPGLTDTWSGYAAERNSILDFIAEKGITDVVFLSGDVHAAMACEITNEKYPNFKVLSVVSSPFYWPVTHGKPSHFKQTGNLTSSHNYKINTLIKPYCDENFALVEATLDRLKITIKDRKGNIVDSMIMT